jgi:hypothetical protein
VYFLEKISIEAGPQISYAINKSSKTSYAGSNLGEILQVNDFDYGVSAGATMNVTSKYFIQLRGVYGFNEITKTTGVPQIDSFVVKNRALQLSVGYMF